MTRVRTSHQQDALPPGWLRDLLVGHDPTDPPEATLTLAAAAAMSGIRCDGELMDGGSFAQPPSLHAIARQLNQPISSVRRGIRHLELRGAACVDDGIIVDAAAMAHRWSNHRQRIRITTGIRLLGMRPRPLLVAALVAGQVDQRGQLRLGVQYWTQRTGLPERTLKRALATAENYGAIHTWLVPPKWQLFSALGPSPTGSRRGSRRGTRRCNSSDCSNSNDHPDNAAHHEEAQPPVANRPRPHHEPAPSPSRRGPRHPDSSRVPPDSPSEPPASPAGETIRPRTTSQKSETEPRAFPTPADAEAIVEAWVLAFVSKGIEHLAGREAEVAGLLDQLGTAPPLVHDRVAFISQRRALAASIVRWCPGVERLGRWLIRGSRWFGIRNLPGYLRRACGHGDPGTLLDSHTKNRLRRAQERWRDFSPATERDLAGKYAVEVEKLVAGCALVAETLDEAAQQHLRNDLQLYLRQNRPAAARAVLLKLVGHSHSEQRIQGVIDGVMTLAQAKRLLGVA